MAGRHRRDSPRLHPPAGRRGRQSPLRTPVLSALGLGLAVVGPAVLRIPPTMLTLSGPDGSPSAAAPAAPSIPTTPTAPTTPTVPAAGPGEPTAAQGTDLPPPEDPDPAVSPGAEQR